ncbi:hypothetical protein [Rhodopila sp.]|uniref:hypothetical protein n=1 Tax=Rhodopila sp. TaxID=2480087 RepID=UPI003D0BB6C3
MSDNPSGVSNLREVRATFSDPQHMQDAVSKLSLSGFDRADLTLPTQGHSLDEAASESATKPASTGVDAQQARALGGGTVGAAVALAAAGITIATGGAAAPAIAAAVVAGGAAGGATTAVIGAGSGAEQQAREAQAAEGGLMLSVRTRTAANVAEATNILRAAGATNIETIE